MSQSPSLIGSVNPPGPLSDCGFSVDMDVFDRLKPGSGVRIDVQIPVVVVVLVVVVAITRVVVVSATAIHLLRFLLLQRSVQSGPTSVRLAQRRPINAIVIATRITMIGAAKICTASIQAVGRVVVVARGRWWHCLLPFLQDAEEAED